MADEEICWACGGLILIILVIYVIVTYFIWILLALCILVIIVAVIMFIKTYNWFYSKKNASEASIEQIRVAMKKRLDMIEQLLGAVKSYAKFERETLERVTSMRTLVAKAGPGDLNKVEVESRSLVGRLFAVAENYPDLKTNYIVMDLTASIKAIENEIANHRYSYNQITQEFNTKMDTIPTNFVGRIIGLQKLDYLKFEETITLAPKIAF